MGGDEGRYKPRQVHDSANVSGIIEKSIPVWTTFEVFEPLLSRASTQIGTTYVNPNGQMGLGPVVGMVAGMSFQAAVDDPNIASSVGKWCFLDTLESSALFQTPTYNVLATVFGGGTFLDEIYPYNGYYASHTGVHTAIDSPKFGKGGLATRPVVWATYGGVFQTYIMYIAPGKGSIPVPLARADWSFQVAEISLNKIYVRWGAATQPYAMQFSLCDVEPEWGAVDDPGLLEKLR